MPKCEICGKKLSCITHTHLKLHKISIEEYKTRFPEAKLSWNSGLTKETDLRVLKISNKVSKSMKGKRVGHPNYYSKEYLGTDFDEIEQNRREKISKTFISKNIGLSNTAQCKKAHDNIDYKSRKGNWVPWNKNLTKESDDKVLKISNKLKGRTKYTDPGLARMAAKRRKYPEGIDFKLYGWSQERAQEIRKRDYFTCQKCGKKRVSIVHHKDGDRRHNDDNNLVTLCRKCHREVHVEHDITNGRFKLRVFPLPI